MGKNSKTKDSKEQDFTRNEIDALIEKIIDKNKIKLESLPEKTPEDKDKKVIFEFYNKALDKSDKIYYLKEKDKDKKDKKDILSGKIINDARENLGKKPIDIESKVDALDSSPKVKRKIKIRFGKTKYSSEENDIVNENKIPPIGSENQLKINDADQIIDGKLYEKIVDEIDEEIDKLNLKVEKGEEVLNKEGIFNKYYEIKDKQNVELKKKIEFKSENKKLDLKPNLDDSFESYNIQETKEKSKNKTKKDQDKSYEKGLYDAKDKPIKTKQNTIIDKDQFIGKEHETFKPKFRVEKVPSKEIKDKKLFDNELIKKDVDKKFDKSTEKKKSKFKENYSERTDKPSINENKSNVFPALSLDNDLKQEHKFFDEDVGFAGWSPYSKDEHKENLEPDISTDLQEGLKNENIRGIKDVELPKRALSLDSIKLSDLGFSEQDWDELDFYPLYEPFAYVEILREKETLEKRYFLVEIELNDEEKKILDFINETFYHVSIETEDLELKGEEEYLAKQINQIINEYNINVKKESFDKILYYFSKSALGFGKIDPLMRDPNIEDISCDGAGLDIFLYHRKYGSLKSNIDFSEEENLSAFIFKLAQKCGKHISIAEPMVDATMPDGSRIQMTLSDEITAHGSTFTIRKFRSDPFSPPDLVEFNTMSSEMIAYMWLAIENGTNMLFAGGTASGKTSTLNALSLFIPRESKIVSIEETREINLPHPNWIPGVARSGFGDSVANKSIGKIDMYDLMKAALRQRPEYILVGEIRGKEAYVLFQAMATGHATYSTVHADSAQSLIHRLEGKPISIPRVMLQSLDVVSIHIITKVNNKRARRCKQIIEIIDIDPTTKEILTNEVFRWDPVEDRFVYSGKSYILERIRAEKDFNRDQIAEEIENRMKLVEYMNESNIRGFRNVAQLVSKYVDNPQTTLKQIK